MTEKVRKVNELVKLAELHAHRSEMYRHVGKSGVKYEMSMDMVRHHVAQCAYYAMQASALGYVW